MEDKKELNIEIIKPFIITIRLNTIFRNNNTNKYSIVWVDNIRREISNDTIRYFEYNFDTLLKNLAILNKLNPKLIKSVDIKQ